MHEQAQDFIIGTGLLMAFLLVTALYIYCIVDIHKHPTRYVSKRTTWLNIVWMAPVLGCFIYLMNRRRLWKQTNTSF